MDYKNLPTPALIERCTQKDPLAWAEFVSRFMPLINFSIKKALSIYSPDRKGYEDIKDISQGIITALLSQNRLNEVTNRKNIDYWLAITARNATINHLKAKRKEILIGDESYFEKFAAEETEKSCAKPEEEEPGEKIEAIFGRLSPREKIIFKLYFGRKLHLKDISKIMNLPLGTVSSVITRMRKKIKK